MHSDCSWDKKCVLFPLPISQPDSGSIFAYKCVMRAVYDNNAKVKLKGECNRHNKCIEAFKVSFLN